MTSESPRQTSRGGGGGRPPWPYLLASSLMLSCSWTAGLPNVDPITKPMDTIDKAVWVPASSSVYFITKSPGTINRFDGSTVYTTQIEGQDMICFILPMATKNKFVVGAGPNLVTIFWDGVEPGPIKVESTIPFNVADTARMSTGKVDVMGRLWIAKHDGSLQSVVHDGANNIFATDLGHAQSIAWNMDNTILYSVDPYKSIVLQHECNLLELSFSVSQEGSTFFDFGAHNLSCDPYGLAVDKTDCVWVSCHDNDGFPQLVQLEGSTGVVKLTVPLNVTGPISSMTFDGSTMYATSFANDFPDSGSLFKVTNTGVEGIPNVAFVYEPFK